MIISCPNPKCVLVENSSPRKRLIVRNGTYKRASDSRRIHRFHCRNCHSYFSRATGSERYGQKVRRINEPLKFLLVSGISQRRAALLLGVDRKTVARRFHFLAVQARNEQAEWLEKYKKQPLAQVQFDDLESSIHTKCKPVSVSLAVEPKQRKILSFQVSEMPAKGHLAAISRKKYGPRKDLRPQGWERLMLDLKALVIPNAQFASDENPHYPTHLRAHFPLATHLRFPGGRGAITGQGELKKKVFDPLFALNHTCAMLRANLNRLFRKTWCTSKNIQGLIDHISLYVSYHNRTLTP